MGRKGRKEGTHRDRPEWPRNWCCRTDGRHWRIGKQISQYQMNASILLHGTIAFGFLSIATSAAQLSIAVTDTEGNPLPSRIHLAGSDGNRYAPSICHFFATTSFAAGRLWLTCHQD